MESNLKGWHSRGYLPHFDGGEVLQFITFRLADSLPASLIEQWKIQFKHEPENEFHEQIEKYLDAGYGSCFLRDEKIASLVEDALLFFDRQKYTLYSWIIMPNHVHFLIQPLPDNSLSGILHSIKSYTATMANKNLNRKGEFWQEDYFDRYIRSPEHYWQTVNYIENNPVKAGLCKCIEEWRFGSANHQIIKPNPALD